MMQSIQDKKNDMDPELQSGGPQAKFGFHMFYRAG